MLGADMLMAEPFRFFCRILRMRLHSALSGTSTEVEIRSRIVMRASISLRIDSIDPAAAEIGSQRLVLAHQAEQQMLRLDVRAAVLAGFVPRKEYDPTRFLCVPFEHVSSLLPWPCSRRPQPREIAERHVPVQNPVASRGELQIVRRDQRRQFVRAVQPFQQLKHG